MKKTKRLWALLLAMVMALGLISTAFAAPTIDSGRKASLSLYKYDITAASADGAWDAASYVSTGVQDDAVTDKLAQYAIQGVEFTYLRVADIAMNNELVNGQRQVGVLYGFAEDTILQAIGLTTADAYKSESGIRLLYLRQAEQGHERCADRQRHHRQKCAGGCRPKWRQGHA